MSFLSIFGAALVGLVFCDVFATILLARAGGGVISPYLNRLVWKIFLATDRAVNADGRVMAFAGPILLVLIVALWVAIAISGFALMYLPLLGTGITASSGSTANDFATAFYYSGFNFSTLGLGDLVPQTTTTKLLTVGEACTGFAVFTMAVSYTLSIYGAVNDRDALALLLHADTGETDDPSVSLAGLCPGGSPAADAGSSMHALSANLSALLQTHYSYPLVHYYRRCDASLSIVRIADHAVMLVALAKACLTEETNAALLRSRGFISADAAGTRLICEIVKMMHVRERRQAFDVELLRPWFDRAYGRLARAGIDLADQGTGWLEFSRLVGCVKPKIIGLAGQLGYRECEFTSG